MRKALGSEVINFMKAFKIDKRIVEALNGSYIKTSELKVT